MNKIKFSPKKGILLILIFILFTQNIFALSIVTHVPEKYTDVEPGERFYFDIEVKYPENTVRKDLRLNYEITDLDGNLIAQAKVLKAIETQASFIDFIVIPESTKKGLYILNVDVSDYDDLTAEVSASFNVISSKMDEMKLYMFVTLAAVGFVALLVIIDMMTRRK